MFLNKCSIHFKKLNKIKYLKQNKSNYDKIFTRLVSWFKAAGNYSKYLPNIKKIFDKFIDTLTLDKITKKAKTSFEIALKSTEINNKYSF